MIETSDWVGIGKSETQMSLELKNYSIDKKIFESSNYVIYEVTRLIDGEKLVIKFLNSEYPTIETQAKFRHAVRMQSQFSSPFVIEIIDSITSGHTPGMVMEKGPDSLSSRINKTPMDLTEALNLSIELVLGISEIHSKKIVHKNICPETILWDNESRELKITNFSCATEILYDNPSLSYLTSPEGNLAYLPPEQSGRINRFVDYRADFYSIGITFFEIFTGQRPFEATEISDWVYSHIAKIPPNPESIHSSLPKTVSRIILRLIEKDAEKRYQSSSALLGDLTRCKDEFIKTGKISEFNIAAQDLSGHFTIPQTIYGRRKELKIIQETFKNLPESPTHMILISGFSGVGKTSLARESQKYALRKDGLFAECKFDQIRSTVPCYGIRMILEHIAEKFLALSSAGVGPLKTVLQKDPKFDPETILNIAPGWSAIFSDSISDSIQPHSDPENPNTVETLNIFIRNLLKIYPQTIFLFDDIQWADSFSLNLIYSWLKDEALKGLLIIGTERKTLTGGNSDQNQILSKMAENHHFRSIYLDSLDQSQTLDIVSSTCHADRGHCNNLGELIYLKTKGNPYFIRKLLLFFYHNKYIIFDNVQGRWSWDINRLRKVEIQDNVIDLLLENINNLRPEELETLKFASCIGSTFDLQSLYTIADLDKSKIHSYIRGALAQSLIIPLNQEYLFADSSDTLDILKKKNLRYKFQHEKIHQAFYFLIDDERRKQAHLEIGRLLYKSLPATKLSQRIEELVRHYNKASSLITSSNEKFTQAKLNLAAGELARKNFLIDQAIKYYKISMDLAQEDWWTYHNDFCMSLYCSFLKCAWVGGHHREAEKICKLIRQNAASELDRAKCEIIRMSQYIISNRLEEAQTVGFEALKSLHLNLPPSSGWIRVFKEYCYLKVFSGFLSSSDVLNQPDCTQEKYEVISELISELIVPAFLLGNKKLTICLILKSVNMCMKYGYLKITPVSYIMFASLLNSTFKQHLKARQIAKLAHEAYQRSPYAHHNGRFFFIYCTFILPWQKPLKVVHEVLTNATLRCKTTGDFQYFCYLKWSESFFTPELSIDTLIKQDLEMLRIMERCRFEDMWESVYILYLFRRKLSTTSPNPTNLSDDKLNEADLIVKFKKRKSLNNLCMIHLSRLQLCYHFDETDKALAIVFEIEPVFFSIEGMIQSTDIILFSFLTLSRKYASLSKKDQLEHSKKLTNWYQEIQRWSRCCPENFSHLERIMSAEFSRLQNKRFQAIKYFEDGIKIARDQGFIHHEALINELAALFYIEFNDEKMAGFYLKEAIYCYNKWGASAKVNFLKSKFPVTFGFSTGYSDKPLQNLDQKESYHPDLDAILKASRAITMEMELSELLKKIMQVLRENSGAERGLLFLYNDEQSSLALQCESIGHNFEVLQDIPFDLYENAPVSIIKSVLNSGKTLIIEDAFKNEQYGSVPYIQSHQVRSVLIIPILYQSYLIAVLYLENNLTSNVFSPERLKVLESLTSQAAVSIKNALLYQSMEKKVEERTIELADNIKMLHKAAAKNTNLLRILCHDLTNPLSVVKISMNILTDNTNKYSNEKKEKATGRILRAIQTQEEIIEQVRNMEAIESGKISMVLTPVSIAEVIQKGQFMFAEQLEKKSLKLEIDQEVHDSYVLAEKVSLSNNVLNNLLSNAIKFSFEGSVINIKIRDADGGNIALIVRDFGIGIPKDIRENLFSPDKRTSRKGTLDEKGTGFGMPLVKAFMDQYGGSVTVESFEKESSNEKPGTKITLLFKKASQIKAAS